MKFPDMFFMYCNVGSLVTVRPYYNEPSSNSAIVAKNLKNLIEWSIWYIWLVKYHVVGKIRYKARL